jgi:KDO2-lipid IV(A) lauroyltransferase
MKKKLKHLFEYLLASLVIGFLKALPFRVSVGLGAFFGRLFYMGDRRHQVVALDNLRSALGREKSEEELQRIAVAAFQNLGRSSAEFVRFSGMADAEIQRRVDIEGWEHYLAARAEGRGVVYVTAHFGNWELMATALAFKGFPIHVVARPLDNPYLDRMVNGWRGRGGNQVLNKRIAAAEIIRLLRSRETVGFLMDQNTARDEAVFVDYFGRPAATHKGLAIVALRTGAPMLPVFILREKDRFRVVIEKPLKIVRTGKLEEDIFRTTALFTQVIESYVRRYPDHWLWVHRRWKTQRANAGT